MFFLRVSFQYMYFVPNSAANDASFSQAMMDFNAKYLVLLYVFYPTLCFMFLPTWFLYHSILIITPPLPISRLCYPPPLYLYLALSRIRIHYWLGVVFVHWQKAMPIRKRCSFRMNICFQLYLNCLPKLVEVLDSYFYIPLTDCVHLVCFWNYWYNVTQMKYAWLIFLSSFVYFCLLLSTFHTFSWNSYSIFKMCPKRL